MGAGVFDLYNYSLLRISLVGLAAILAAIEIGRWLGVHVGDQGDDNVSTLEGAAIGLSALMVGLPLRCHCRALRLGATPYWPKPMR